MNTQELIKHHEKLLRALEHIAYLEKSYEEWDDSLSDTRSDIYARICYDNRQKTGKRIERMKMFYNKIK